MIPDTSFPARPHFPSADHWLANAKAAICRGDRPWWPATRDELLLADQSGLLAEFPQWKPGQQGLAMLGLPEWFGQAQPPLDDQFCERHLQALVERPEYRLALATVLTNGGAA